jgi:hypothetical protein
LGAGIAVALGVVGTTVGCALVVPVEVLADEEAEAELTLASCGVCRPVAAAAALAEGSETALGSASGAADAGSAFELFAVVVGEVGVVGVVGVVMVGVGVDGVGVLGLGVVLTVTVSCKSKSPLWCNM